MSSTSHLARAVTAEGLSPEAKLVLILIAYDADMDGRVFAPFDKLFERANVTEAYFRDLVHELEDAGLAVFSHVPDQTDELKPCIMLLGVDPDGR